MGLCGRWGGGGEDLCNAQQSVGRKGEVHGDDPTLGIHRREFFAAVARVHVSSAKTYGVLVVM